MKKRNLLFVTVALLSLIVMLILVFYPATDSRSVRIGYLEITASLPLFIAEEMGYLQEEDILYEAIPFASSNQLVDAIIAGNIDLYVESSAVPVLAAEIRSPGKIKIFSVSEITPQYPFDAILVLKTASMNELTDLEGKRIGVFPGSTATTLLKYYLKTHGLDVSDILFTPMIPPNQLGALLQGSIDALHAYEPTIAIALARDDIRQLHGSVYADMLSPNPQGIAAVNTEFIAAYPTASEKAIRALERAMIFMKENDIESRSILTKRMRIPEHVANKTIFLYMVPHTEVDVSVFQEYSDMLTDLGELDAYVNVSNLLYAQDFLDQNGY